VVDQDVLFGKLIDILKEKKVMTDKVEKTYQVAKELHKNQKRKDGQPYIIHPIEVATILAELNLDIDCVCAGLLHDTVEDCSYTLDDIRENFGDNVAEMVDTVSAIDKEKYVYDNKEIYEDEKFEKFSVDERTFKKLIYLGKKNPLGFYIKFADRLHNLRTISIFPFNKQIEKVRETERWVLPLAKILGSSYFYKEISNECFKIVNQKEQHFFDIYSYYANIISPYMKKITQDFKSCFSRYSMFSEIKYELKKEFEIWGKIKDEIKINNLSNVSQGHMMKISTFDVYVLFKNGTTKKNMFNLLTSEYNKRLSEQYLMIDCELDPQDEHGIFVFKDKANNMFNVHLINLSDYTKYQLGALQGVNDAIIDEENTHEVITNFIKVRTRSNEIILMPENSTVLDFAFKIHNEIGLSFKYAIINNFPTKYPPYTKIHENDKIEIVVEKDKLGLNKNVAELKWFAYVQTENAKKGLIRYFEKKQGLK